MIILVNAKKVNKYYFTISFGSMLTLCKHRYSISGVPKLTVINQPEYLYWAVLSADYKVYTSLQAMRFNNLL